MHIDWFSLVIGLAVGYVGTLLSVTWIVIREDRKLQEGQD